MAGSRRASLLVALAGAAMLVLAPSGPAASSAASCDCLRVRAVATSFNTVENAGQATVAMNLKVTLTCLGGRGLTCSGRLVVQQPLRTPPPTANDVQIATPTNGVIRCNGRCAQATTRNVRVEFRSANDLRFAQRKNEHWVFKLKTFCNDGKQSVPGKTLRIEVLFGSSGEFDAARSDLNANGIADGDE